MSDHENYISDDNSSIFDEETETEKKDTIELTNMCSLLTKTIPTILPKTIQCSNENLYPLKNVWAIRSPMIAKLRQ